MIDFNADLGEGAGVEAELMPLITSASIACGGHAGDAATMRSTLRLAAQHGLRLGAHPSFPDRAHFGRRELDLPSEAIMTSVQEQIAALARAAAPEGLQLTYVKPHGALYNQACRDERVAAAVVAAVVPLGLALMGLPASALERQVLAAGLAFIREGFGDRRYRPDGSLVPRTEADAFIHDPAEAAEQVRWLRQHRGVESICVHGDGPNVVEFTARLRDLLRSDPGMTST
ncbi:MAG TPA: 5-oxoprolinase subunit PxpA [Gemmatales bacterium]|nr:5-oxoprolinase subunit PxpA [Gemmatales bacterium]